MADVEIRTTRSTAMKFEDVKIGMHPTGAVFVNKANGETRNIIAAGQWTDIVFLDDTPRLVES